MTAPTYWPGTKTPKSTGNAFNVALAKPSGFDTGAEKAKAKRLNAIALSAIWSHQWHMGR